MSPAQYPTGVQRARSTQRNCRRLYPAGAQGPVPGRVENESQATTVHTSPTGDARGRQCRFPLVQIPRHRWGQRAACTDILRQPIFPTNVLCAFDIVRRTRAHTSRGRRARRGLARGAPPRAGAELSKAAGTAAEPQLAARPAEAARRWWDGRPAPERGDGWTGTGRPASEARGSAPPPHLPDLNLRAPERVPATHPGYQSLPAVSTPSRGLGGGSRG